jgi:hypothetical protein
VELPRRGFAAFGRGFRALRTNALNASSLALQVARPKLQYTLFVYSAAITAPLERQGTNPPQIENKFVLFFWGQIFAGLSFTFDNLVNLYHQSPG